MLCEQAVKTRIYCHVMFSHTCSLMTPSRYIEGGNLFVCGTYIFNHYVDCRDANHFLSSDKINDVVCLPPVEGAPLLPVLACQDNALRIIKVSQCASIRQPAELERRVYHC